MIMVMIFTALVVTMMMSLLNAFVSWKKTMNRENSSPFECGYDPKSSSRIPFSLQFYLLALIFLIFDVEITMILPMPIQFNELSPVVWVLMDWMFIIILLAGTIHEWKQGCLEWAK